MPRSFVEVAIETDDELREKLVAVVSQLGFEGFWEDGHTLRCYMESDRWDPGLHGELLSITRMLARASSSPSPEISVATIDERNWNEEWEKTLQPIRVTDRIVVTPSWHMSGATHHGVVLIIDPKMSFGTGYHESTRLALMLIERHVRAGVRMLDVGTGTGILAIAAVKLGAGLAVGVDTDEWSYKNAQENARLNQVQEKVTVLRGDLSALAFEQFGLIAANIQRNILEAMLPALRIHLEQDGQIILSGLLQEDREPMLEALLQQGFRQIDELREGQWIAVAASMTEPEGASR
jgi:ribosomal protein L11 methyltransferase